MNREVEYRGKDKYGNWAYGDLIQYSSGETSILNRFSRYGYEATEIINRSKVISGTVGQFTGLRDKNGRKIFEGDIIEKIYYSYHQPECGEIFKVIYEGLGFSFERVKGMSYHTPFTEELEIVGNIYDNPELLKVY